MRRTAHMRFVCCPIFYLNILFSRLLHERYTLLKRMHIPGPAPTWVFGNVKEFRDKVRFYFFFVLFFVVVVVVVFCLFFFVSHKVRF